MRVYCETYGCTANRGDSELILGQLAAAGHEIVPDLGGAEAVIVNTCAVKGKTHQKMLRRLRELRKTGGKHVIVAGCLPLIDLPSVEQIGIFSGIISCRSITALPELLEKVAKGGQDVRKIEPTPYEKPAMRKLRSSRASAVIAICEGCVSNCSYCSVKLARGKLHSFGQNFILNEVKEAIDSGYREILLTGQDTAAYGLDNGTDLSELLNSMCALEGRFRIRVGMMNPQNVKRILPELLRTYESDKVYKFLHLPVQSGDNGILKIMQRGYVVEEFLDIVEAFRGHFPDLYLATDVIVGFPGEGDEEFRHTCEVIERTKPDKVNVTRFSPMPGTDAARMPRPGGHEVAERSRRLVARCLEIGHEQNKRYIGRVLEGLVTEPGKKGGHVVRLPNYKPVVVTSAEPGEFVRLKITEARPTYLLGVET